MLAGTSWAVGRDAMIISSRRHMFGFSHFGVVQGSAFGCAVVTAPEGIFKGCSTVFQAFEGEWATAGNKQLVAKAMLNPSLSKKLRAKVHEAFLTHLDALGNSGVDLPSAIDELFTVAKERKFIVDSISKAHELMNLGRFDPSAAETVSNLLEGNRRQIEADGQRLSALIKKIADRVGEAPVGYNENGEVFVHPELARELEKPGNEALGDMLIAGARANARRQD
jgi:hypothetical protein